MLIMDGETGKEIDRESLHAMVKRLSRMERTG